MCDNRSIHRTPPAKASVLFLAISLAFWSIASLMGVMNAPSEPRPEVAMTISDTNEDLNTR